MIDVTGEAVVIELTGPPRTVNAFMEQITKYPVLEVCRTGVTAMEDVYKRQVVGDVKKFT